MSKVVFDIETVGIPFEDFDEHQKEYWLKFATDEEQMELLKGQTALSPLTGFVCSISLLNPQTQKGQTISVGSEENYTAEDGLEYIFVPNESDLLSQFWDIAKRFDQFISFNGRGFDAPYLMIRSAVHKIRPTKNLMGYRYDSKLHCDLADQLGFYGAMRKAMPLHFYLKAFNIPTSKDGEVKGVEVTQAFRDGKIKAIAEYCMRDVIATAKLYEYWDYYINV